MNQVQTLEFPITGMDCADCTRHVQKAIEKLPRVQSVNVFLTIGKAVVQLDPSLVQMADIRAAVKGVGCDIPESITPSPAPVSMGDFNRRLAVLLVSVFAIISGVVIFGEILG